MSYAGKLGIRDMGWRRSFAASLVSCHVRGAAIIEDHSSTWNSAGLNETLARGFDDVFPQELFDRVVNEALVFEKYEKDERAKAAGGGYMHGKGGTFWRPLFNEHGDFLKPRFAIEAAIIMLYKNDIGSSRHPRVTGGEWWVQKRSLKEDIGFHHDKDEAMASLKSTMKFPEVSTVTYLRGEGAPTVIFNQTTPDGNAQVPISPREGFLSYPRENRHLIFRGNLQHGVPAELAPENGESAVQLRGRGGERITFLVNWWGTKPLGPNCNTVGTKLVKQLGLFDKEGVRELFPVARLQAAQIPESPELVSKHEVEIPGGEMIFYTLPRRREPGNLYSITWPWHTIFGNLCRLNLQGNMVRALFFEPRPKVLVFTYQEEKVLEWLKPLSKEHEQELRFVIANPSKTSDALRAFGLTVADVPIAVIHVTQPQEKKFLMPYKEKREEEGGGRRRMKPSAKSMRKMIKKFKEGRLPPMGGQDADDGDN
ncbi:hypothetical protein GUITHDRAFT_143638 [Guillardia theta CCMP2712]|uniref:Uncharacterized protein n=1 Tax=Guillardia theta (strain CCMP2712) TaxID=905079 RepID=L1ITR8_GUITC|nr:hypothetical protein GUITHDRAFT_143638 [Guillardia theta CCMP2712]EKX39230.1 hypothetical protein GUITHDRAFT_143638 [Guillardia theta CCMP2712]|eukprot:XP_005826210.1 hypothetical protein GUITHDRAFT_143638 [Guillardia theta CCMP2712]